jgi:ribosome-associated toxin RatA of RatAB toxin-antitoxin module
MGQASRTEVFDVEIDKLYKAIINYESYPEFVDGVNKVNVIQKSDDSAVIEYSLNMIKEFKYTLKLEQNYPSKVTWDLKSGDLFKSNSGEWSLVDLGNGKTEVTYNIDVDFKVFAPKMIVNKLVSNNLPAMMNSFKERALAQ